MLVAASLAVLALAGGPDETRFLHQLNLTRGRHGLVALYRRPDLTRIAAGHTRWMVRHHKLTHRGFQGRYRRSRRWKLNESVGWQLGAAKPRRLVRDLMRSPPHRVNMLDREVRQAGVAATTHAGRTWWTVVLGSHRSR